MLELTIRGNSTVGTALTVSVNRRSKRTRASPLHANNVLIRTGSGMRIL